MFFCVWRGRQVFCEFPLEWSFEIVIGEDILKQGFGYDLEMPRILTEPGVAKIRRFGLGIVLIWKMLLAELKKV